MGVFCDVGRPASKKSRNPSAIFLSREDEGGGSGSIIATAWEGSRPLLVEIQALVADANSNYPKTSGAGD